MIRCTARSVTSTLSAMARAVIRGSAAIASSTCAWLVRKVQGIVLPLASIQPMIHAAMVRTRPAPGGV
jgi:hypothetical protein